MFDRTSPMKISIVNSLVVDRDAISNVVRHNADALGKVPGGSDVRIYVQYDGKFPDARIRCVPDQADLAADEHFRRSDIVVYHFGYRYELIKTIQLAPRTAHVVAFFFGVTPPHLMPAAATKDINDSYFLGSHLAAADTVIVTANSLKSDLKYFGVPEDRVRKLGLPVSFRPGTAARPADGPTRFLYVSRFVAAKGGLDLIAGFAAATARGLDGHLDMVGSLTFSDQDYMRKLRAAVADNGLGRRVTFHHDVSTNVLADLFSGSHCLVSPSYHEGFGVPIVEALSCGTYVICSDAYASPETAGGMGLVFKTGDAASLADALTRFATARDAGYCPFADGSIPAAEWHRRAAAYAGQFAPDRYAEAFRAVCLAGLKDVPNYARQYGADEALRLLPPPFTKTAAPETAVYAKFNALWAGRTPGGIRRRSAA